MKHHVPLATIACLVLALLLAGASPLPAAWAQDVGPQGDAAVLTTASTAFSFQGRLMKNGAPVDGVTCTFTFALHAAASGGSSLETVSPTAPVSDGYFTVEVDYGVATFKGEARWLEVSVQCPGDGSAVALSDKRIPLDPAPYALSLRPGAFIEATSAHALSVKTAATSGAALDASATASTGNAAAVFGTSASANGAGISGLNSATGYGVYGRCDSGSGVYGVSDNSYGVKGVAAIGYGVYGIGGSVSVWPGNPGSGVWGDSASSYGVHGTSDSDAGVMGRSDSDAGVLGQSDTGPGAYGTAQTTGTVGVATSGAGVTFGLYGKADSSSGYGVYSEGNAHVEGKLTWRVITSYVSVSVAAFVLSEPTDGHALYDNDGASLRNLSDDYEWFVAPVSLPHGAVVTELTVGYRIDSDDTAQLYLRRRPMLDVTQGNETLAEVGSVGSSGSIYHGVWNDDTIEYATVDNASYTYFLDVYMPPRIEDIKVLGVVIEYTITEPY